MQSARHMTSIQEILDGCGFPAQRFRSQSRFISAMLAPGEEPIAGCIGRQYAPPPEHDFPMLILATNIRITAFISNTDVNACVSTVSNRHPLNLIDEIYVYDSDNADGEIRIRYRGNRRVAAYREIVTSVRTMMDRIDQLDYGIKVYRTAIPMEEVFSRKERLSHRVWRLRKRTERLLGSSVLTILLNILLAIAVIAQAIALIWR